VTYSLGIKIMMESQAAASKNFPSKRVGRSQNSQTKWIGKWPVCLEYTAKQVGSKDDFLFPLLKDKRRGAGPAIIGRLMNVKP